MATAPSWLQRIAERPRLLLGSGVVLLAGLAAAIHFAMAAEEARRQEAERAQALQLRLDTRLKLEALARQQEALEAQERAKHELARRDTTAFQQAALAADIASQDRDLRVQRRTAVERQSAQLVKERERRQQELQTMLKEEVKKQLAQEESEACLTAFRRYEASKRDPATAPEKLASEFDAVKQLCNT
jgi:flagellar biosynthesis GTPase FlhF